ncbi:hypothetical protein NQ317_013185 [Molorchus minor]|uniref:Uncharacterized protein n=1 Tax=Molorchus minor TaxID=1323400 RepID=A0ABQ9IQI7_9CUCU|nr:hypothetical protein NQ317_013185 [Molorchus minor]
MLSHVENPETSASSSISETRNFEQHGLTLTVNSNHNSNVRKVTDASRESTFPAKSWGKVKTKTK